MGSARPFALLAGGVPGTYSLTPEVIPQMPILSTEKVSKCFGEDSARVFAVRDVDLEIESGEFVAIVGPSGSGKSTLLHLLGLVELPTSGRVVFEGEDTSQLGDGRLSELRRRRMGFVFQKINLLPTLRAIENVSLPLLLDGVGRREAERRSAVALEKVGMTHRSGNLPSAMSGGEQQRVAIARALVFDPGVILADEPTGALDSGNTRIVIDLLRSLNQDGHTIVVVTHDARVAEASRRILNFRDGQIESVTQS